jgi:hypothetical protein
MTTHAAEPEDPLSCASVQAPISHALLAAGVVDRSEEGFVFPFDAIRVEFTLQAAA